MGGDRGFAAGIAADGRREAGAVYTMLLIVVKKSRFLLFCYPRAPTMVVLMPSSYAPPLFALFVLHNQK